MKLWMIVCACWWLLGGATAYAAEGEYEIRRRYPLLDRDSDLENPVGLYDGSERVVEAHPRYQFFDEQSGAFAPGGFANPFVVYDCRVSSRC